MITVTFVGGPSHGQTKVLPRWQPSWEVPVMDRLSPCNQYAHTEDSPYYSITTAIKRVRYTLSKPDTYGFCIGTAEGLNPHDVLDALCALVNDPDHYPLKYGEKARNAAYGWS